VGFSSSIGVELVAVFGVAFLVWYVLSLSLVKIGRRVGVSRAQLVALRKLIHMLAIVLAMAGIVNVLGLGSELELLTLGGLGVLIGGLAIEGLASSLVYGFFAFEEDTLRLGDIVEIPGSGKGRVVKVNLRNIWVKTDNGGLVVVDNSRIEHGRLVNYSAAERLEKHFDSKDSIR